MPSTAHARSLSRYLSPLAVAALALPPLLVRPSAPPPQADAPIVYTLDFPAPGRRVVEVEALFAGVGREPLEIRFSRTSPGRYALHEFAKNVFGERAADGGGRPLLAERRGPHTWTVAGHDGTVRFSYSVYGDRVDGTYLAVDETHAHLNLPAVIAWSPGLERRPARLVLRRPPGADRWTVATQLQPTADPLVFTAPNLAYLLDSPIEFGETDVHSSTIETRGGRRTTLRVALHAPDGRRAQTLPLAAIERIVREQEAVFGELPVFEPGHYTFLIDALPWAHADGMEHRNSTVITTPVAPGPDAGDLLDTIAHEFFHAWNVERIRPASLEPFDLTEAAAPAELWFAEGFTSYYGPLSLVRAGLEPIDAFAGRITGWVNAVMQAPARQFRSAAEMSRLASFFDGACWTDRTNLSITVLSYYTHGAALALALDLSLRAATDDGRGLDALMRELWARHGGAGGAEPGYVARPYTVGDLRAALAEVARSRAFADTFFDRFVEGREAPDFAALLARAGFSVRRVSPGLAWLGPLELRQDAGGLRVAGVPAPGTPAGDAGLAEDDLIVAIDGEPVATFSAWHDRLRRTTPGDRLDLIVERRGRRTRLAAVAGEDPTIEVAAAERAGGALTPAHRAFREAWLGPQAVERVTR
jgi:predicted metalloprotease with PDZ domain